MGILAHVKRIVTLAVLAACAAQGFPQNLDPILTRNHRALSLAFLRLPPRSSVLEPGRSEWNLNWTEANDLRKSEKPGGGELMEDYEIARFSVSWRRALSPGREVGIELPLVSRGSGFLDSIIDWWHAHLLGWAHPLRDGTPRNQCQIAFPDGTRFGSATGFGDVSGFFTESLNANTSATLAVKLPTGNANDLTGSGGLDVGAAVQWSKMIWPKWSAGAQVGLVYQGQPAKLEGGRIWADQEALWLVWLKNSKDSWIVQWQSEASPLRSHIPASDATHRIVTFGYRRKVSESQQWEAFFTEDRDLFAGKWPEGANTGPDFTIGLTYTIRK